MSVRLERHEEVVAIVGEMTIPNAARLLAEGKRELASGATVFDLSGVTGLDSSGLAVIFGWQREAAAKGVSMSMRNPPGNLKSLAEVYGVGEFLPLSA